MADAWEILVAGSSLPSGDAWEHLNTQVGSSGCSGLLTADIVFDAEADVYDNADATVSNIMQSLDIAESLSSVVDNDNLTTEVCS